MEKIKYGGMYMEEEMVKELARKYNRKEKVIENMWKITKKYGYSIVNFKTKISEFYKIN